MDTFSFVIVIGVIGVLALVAASSLGWIGFDLTIPAKPRSHNPPGIVAVQLMGQGRKLSGERLKKMGTLLGMFPNVRSLAYDDDGAWVLAIAPVAGMNLYGAAAALQLVLETTDEELDKLPELPPGKVKFETSEGTPVDLSPAVPQVESQPELPPESLP